MHKTRHWTICTYAFGVYLISADGLLRCCSAHFGARRWKLHAHAAPSMLRCAQMCRSACLHERTNFSWTTWKERWPWMLGGSGCQGKRSCQENREETMGTRKPADQSESSPSPFPVVRIWPATHGRPLCIARDCAWNVLLSMSVEANINLFGGVMKLCT